MRINSFNKNQPGFGKVIKASVVPFKLSQFPADWKNSKCSIVSMAMENASKETRVQNREILEYLKQNIAKLSGEKSPFALLVNSYFLTGEEAKKVKKIQEDTAEKIERIEAKRDYSNCDGFFDEIEVDNGIALQKEEAKKLEEESINEILDEQTQDKIEIKIDSNGKIKEVECYKEYKNNNKKPVFKKSFLV